MKLITLVAGQSCFARCRGQLRVKLYTGNVEIAGATLLSNVVATFVLELNKPLHLYTLEGCVIGLQPDSDEDSKLSTEISKLAIGTLLKFIKKGFETTGASVNAAGLAISQARGGVRIAVVGDKGAGRYLAACTVTNALNRTKSDGSIFCDLTTCVDGQLSKLGCLGCIETHAEVPLWQGMQWSTYTASMLFYHGITSPIIHAKDLTQYLTPVASACESASWMSQQKSDCPIIFVLPSFDEATVSRETFYRATMEIIKPTHVIFTGDEEGGTHQTLGRLLPTAKLMYCSAVVASNSRTEVATSSALTTAVSEYFQGTSLNPLGTTLITVPLSSIQFVTLKSQSSSSEVVPYTVIDDGDNDNPSNPSASLVGVVCAVSHAGTISEAAYANIAGLVVIVDVFADRDEVELLSPSSDAMLPSKILIVSEHRVDSATLQKLSN